MISIAKCQHCQKEFEFEVGNKTEFCPICGKETFLNLPTKSTNKANKTKMIPCDSCNHQHSREAWFCFECGKFHASLFSIVWRVVCCVIIAGALLDIIYLSINKLLEIVFGK
jgi:rRNA maturation endonuclease Nob1